MSPCPASESETSGDGNHRIVGGLIDGDSEMTGGDIAMSSATGLAR